MAIAIALILIVVGSVLFHFFSPWTLAPLASNWGTIDVTMGITLIITAIVFVAVTLFVALAVLRFKHDPNRTAKYEPENKKLEIWLTVITSIGIVAMLAPGLVVYSDFVNVPDDAMEVEVVGQQWSWSFRFPGQDGQIGKSAVEHMSIDNPLGLDPLDGSGQDDYIIQGNRLLLPQGKPVKVLLRSKDVLHDFYVPQFRVKMDMVPGIVSYLWFEPTVVGEYEILCAEFCGIGHFNMRAVVEVVEQQQFDQWLSEQATFASIVDKQSTQELSVAAQQGKDLAQVKGCMACHNFEQNSIGPTWKGVFGATKEMVDGRQIQVDDAYLAEAILQPAATVVKGFAPVMPPLPLTDLEVEALIAYIKEGDPSAAVQLPLSGQELAQNKGCIACHSLDGTKLVGPTWKGVFGSSRELTTGETITVDEAYLKESLFQPNAKLVAGYPPVMPPAMLNEAEAMAIIDFIKSLD